MAFLHAHLVAHGDFSQGEFLLNYSGSRCCPEAVKAEHEHGPFRRYFPCRYYLVDFETAITFDEASDTASRVVKPFAAFSAHNIKEPKQYAKVVRSDILTLLTGLTPSMTGFYKPMPPEWASDTPYCPFASDVYQLSKLWQESFVVSTFLCFYHAISNNTSFR